MAVDYEVFIADLEAKRAAFNAWVDGAIQNIRQIQAAMAGVPLASNGSTITPGPSTETATPGILTPDAFFGLSLAEAAIKILQTVKKQQTTREITDALEAASYHHTSQNFINTVNTALYRRERDEGDVVRIGRNWALSEWYPGRRKNRQNRAVDLTEFVDPADEAASGGEESNQG